eukprot:scaffold1667_cov411-Prasinococcus_capsulatus_cf.AAC.6
MPFAATSSRKDECPITEQLLLVLFANRKDDGHICCRFCPWCDFSSSRLTSVQLSRSLTTWYRGLTNGGVSSDASDPSAAGRSCTAAESAVFAVSIVLSARDTEAIICVQASSPGTSTMRAIHLSHLHLRDSTGVRRVGNMDRAATRACRRAWLRLNWWALI